MVCRGWHPHFPPVAWCVCSSCGVFASFYATRSRPPDRRGRSSRRLYEGLYIYVMHRLYTQGLVVGILWSGAPDVVARATHKRSALELGARPTGNWRRGAAGLNSHDGSPAAASGAVGRDRRGRRAAGVKLRKRESRGAAGSWRKGRGVKLAHRRGESRGTNGRSWTERRGVKLCIESRGILHWCHYWWRRRSHQFR